METHHEVSQSPDSLDLNCLLCRTPASTSCLNSELKLKLVLFFCEILNLTGNEIKCSIEECELNEYFPFCSTCVQKLLKLFGVHENLRRVMDTFYLLRDEMVTQMVTHNFSGTEETKKSKIFESLQKNYWNLKMPVPKPAFFLTEVEMSVSRTESETLAPTVDTYKPSETVVSTSQCSKLNKKPSKTSARIAKFRCQVCDKAFTSRQSLVFHSRKHTGEKPYQCDQCLKSFKTPYYLIVHKRLHTGITPYSCHLCDKKFPDRNHLNSHLKTHSGLKPYKCQECNKMFRTKTHVTRHMRTHTGEKPYSCHLCAKRFSIDSNLKEHLLRHTGEKSHNCPACTEGFYRKKLLQKHMDASGHKYESNSTYTITTEQPAQHLVVPVAILECQNLDNSVTLSLPLDSNPNQTSITYFLC